MAVAAFVAECSAAKAATWRQNAAGSSKNGRRSGLQRRLPGPYPEDWLRWAGVDDVRSIRFRLNWPRPTPTPADAEAHDAAKLFLQDAARA